MNGRERYFNTVNFRNETAKWLHGPVAKDRTFFAGGSWNAGSNPGIASSSFFTFIVFLPFGFLLFILTADLVSFARFLRKRISSLHIFITLSPSFHGFTTNQFNDLLPVGFLAQIDGFHSDVTNLHSQKSEVLGISNGHIGGPKLSANMASPYKALQRSMKCFGK